MLDFGCDFQGEFRALGRWTLERVTLVGDQQSGGKREEFRRHSDRKCVRYNDDIRSGVDHVGGVLERLHGQNRQKGAYLGSPVELERGRTQDQHI